MIRLAVFIIIVFCFPLGAQETIGIGDSVLDYLDLHQPRFKMPGENVFSAREAKIEYLLFSKEIKDEEPVILLAGGEYVIGIVRPEGEDARIILDVTGDGVLDLEFPEFIPARVYQWQLETDQEKKDGYFNRLKANSSEHWIVKMLK